MLKLKICGLTDPENIKALIELEPSMIGFIFFSSSERNFQEESITIPSSIEKVGIFVDATPKTIEETITKHQLNAIQLYHDDLSPFQYLRSKVRLIKAIAVTSEKDILNSKRYNDECDLFLFDTKGEKAGGNGIKFDWRILSSYQDETPFILSGGIDEHDVNNIKAIKHEKLYGIDINSKFELKPGIKNIIKIKQFKEQLYESIEHIK